MNHYDGNDIRDIVLYSIEHDDTIYSLVEKLNHNFDQILRHERTDFMDVIIKSVLQSIANGKYSDILGSNGQRIIMIGKPGRDGRDGFDGNTIVQSSQSTKFLSKKTGDLREIQHNSYSISIPNDPSLESERVALLRYRPGDIVFTKDGDIFVVDNITDQEIFLTRKMSYKSITGGGNNNNSPGGSGGISSPSSPSFLIDTDQEGSRVKEHILQSTERILLGIHNPSRGESNANTKYYNLGLGIGKHASGEPTLAIANIPRIMTSDANSVDSGIHDQMRFYFRKNSQQSFDESQNRFWSFLRYIDLYEDTSNRSAVTGQKLRFGLENNDSEDTNQPFIELLTDKRSMDSYFMSFTNTMSVQDPNTKMSIMMDNRQMFSIKTSKNGVKKNMLSTDINDEVLSTEYQYFHAPTIQTDTITPKSGDSINVPDGKYINTPKIKIRDIIGSDSGKLHVSGNTILTIDDGSDISISGQLLGQWMKDSDKKIKDFDKKKMRINTLFSNEKTETSGFEIDLRSLGFPLFNPSGDNGMKIKSGDEFMTHKTESISHIYLPIFTKTSTGSVSRYSTLHRLFGIFTHDDVDDLSGTPFANTITERDFVWSHYGKKETKISKEDAMGGRISDFEKYVRIPVFELSEGDISYSHIMFPRVGYGINEKMFGRSLVMRPIESVSGHNNYSVEFEKKHRTYYIKLHDDLYNSVSDENKPSGFKIRDGWSAFEYDTDDINTYQKTLFQDMRVDLRHDLRYKDESSYDQTGKNVDLDMNATEIECRTKDGVTVDYNMRNGMTMSGTFISYSSYAPNIDEHFISMLQHGTYFIRQDAINGSYSESESHIQNLQKAYRFFKKDYYNYYKRLYNIAYDNNNIFFPVKFRENLPYYPFSDRSLNCVPCNTKVYTSLQNSKYDNDSMLYSNDMFSIKVTGDTVFMDIYVECSMLESDGRDSTSIYKDDAKRFAYQRYAHLSPTFGSNTSSMGRYAKRFLMTDVGNDTAEILPIAGDTTDDIMPDINHRTYRLHDVNSYNPNSPIYKDSGFNFTILIPNIVAPITDIMFADNTTIYSDDLCSVSISPYHHLGHRMTHRNNTNIKKRVVKNIKTPFDEKKMDAIDGVQQGSIPELKMYDNYGTTFSGFTTLAEQGFGYVLENAIDLGFSPDSVSYTPIMVSFRNPNDIQPSYYTSNSQQIMQKTRAIPRSIAEYVVDRGTGVKFKKISLTWVKPGLSDVLDSLQAKSMNYGLGNTRLPGKLPEYSSHKLYSSLLRESMEKYDTLYGGGNRHNNPSTPPSVPNPPSTPGGTDTPITDLPIFEGDNMGGNTGGHNGEYYDLDGTRYYDPNGSARVEDGIEDQIGRILH